MFYEIAVFEATYQDGGNTDVCLSRCCEDEKSALQIALLEKRITDRRWIAQ